MYKRQTVRRSTTDDEGVPSATRVTVDGVAQDNGFIMLIDDRTTHEVEVWAGARLPAAASLVVT